MVYFGTYISHVNLASQWIAVKMFMELFILAKKMKEVQNFLVHRLDLYHADKTDLSKTLSAGVYNTEGKGINWTSGQVQDPMTKQLWSKDTELWWKGSLSLTPTIQL